MFMLTRFIKVLVLLALLAPTVVFAAAKKYQVTGKVLELSDTLIVVEKDDEKWEIQRDPSTKIEGDLKLGAKVTIRYRCVASDVEVKGKAAAPAK